MSTPQQPPLSSGDANASVAGEEDPGAALDLPSPDTAVPAPVGPASVRRAHITGKVAYREGDGANITIRPGPCTVEESALDVTISWTDGDTRGVAAMPLADYRHCLAVGAIQLDGPTLA